MNIKVFQCESCGKRTAIHYYTHRYGHSTNCERIHDGDLKDTVRM